MNSEKNVEMHDEFAKMTDEELNEEINSLNSPKSQLLKYKLDLLKIYLLHKNLCTGEEKGDKKIKQILKQTAILIEKINNLLNKVTYKEKTGKFDDQTRKEIEKNEGIIYLKSSKKNPKKSNREKIEILEQKNKKKPKLKINDKKKNQKFQ